MINQKGLYLVSQAVGRILVKNGKGVIVNMASEAGLEGSEGQSAYAATKKAAVYSYTRSWAKELGSMVYVWLELSRNYGSYGLRTFLMRKLLYPWKRR